MSELIQIDGEVREATADELAQLEQARQEEIALQEAKAHAVEARKEPLRKLGLTEDEISVVLGL